MENSGRSTTSSPDRNRCRFTNWSAFVALRFAAATALFGIVTFCFGCWRCDASRSAPLFLFPVAFRMANTTVHVHPVQQYYEDSSWRDVCNPHGLLERCVPEERHGPVSHRESSCSVATIRGTSSPVRPCVALGGDAMAGQRRPSSHRESVLLRAHLWRHVLFGAARRRPASC